jgi:hypothetical protein
MAALSRDDLHKPLPWLKTGAPTLLPGLPDAGKRRARGAPLFPQAKYRNFGIL